MNTSKFFELAKQSGISECQLQICKNSNTKIKLFRGEIDEFKVSQSSRIYACGIYEGKRGFAYSEKLDSKAFENLVNAIILSAKYNDKPDIVGIFKGEERYKKRNCYNKELPAISLEEKIALLRKLEKSILSQSELVSEADGVSYAEAESEMTMLNSFGLKLKNKNNFFYFIGGAVVKKDGETKTYYQDYFGQDLKSFDPDELAKTVVDRAIAKLGGNSVDSGNYPVILDRDVFASLLGYYVDAAVADTVQRHSSFLEGRIGAKVAAAKVTITEDPLKKGPFYSYFDDEGVATKKKDIVKRGVLQTYLYNRETAKKDGRETTGNGSIESGKIGTDYGSIYVKPGKQSLDDLAAKINKGVYITELGGLGTGMNSESGNFSCQAEGFAIEDGKIRFDKPIALITLSGNLLKMLSQISGLDNRCKLDSSGFCVPDAFIKKMAIGGN